jgi:voltage-gated potassium channel
MTRDPAHPLRFGVMRKALGRLRLERGAEATPILVRRPARSPEATLGARIALVVALMFAVFTVFLIDRDGLRDNIDGQVSVVDVIYFTMITISTVGYGDIVPVSDTARLIDAFFVTPVRIFVWFIFIGTAYQLLIQRLLEEWRMTRLQRDLEDHVILCGYGHSGSIAASELRERGWSSERITVIDQDADAVQRAAAAGFIGLHGDASSEELLRVAGVPRARAVIVSVGRDDTTVLIVLTVRALSKTVRAVASVGEQENVKLVRASGADVIVSPPRFGGYLLADAISSETTVEFVTEMLSYHGDHQMVERDAAPHEIGRVARELDGTLVIEVRRGDRRLGGWKHRDLRIEQNDRLLVIDSDEALARTT